MPRLIEENNASDTVVANTGVVNTSIDNEPVIYNNRLPFTGTDIVKEEEQAQPTKLKQEKEIPQLSIADFRDNPEVQERAYRAVNYLYNSKYDDKTDAVDKYIDMARQADFNLTSSAYQYAQLLKEQKKDDPESKKYVEDISWLYNEFYKQNKDGKYKYDATGLKENLALTGDIIQGAVTDLTNWATALTFPFTGGSSAAARVVAGETAKQGLKAAMKNAVSKTYKAIPKVPIDPRKYSQTIPLTMGEGFVIGSTDNYLRQKRFNAMGVEGYEDFSTKEMLQTGAFSSVIGGGIGGATTFGYRYFDARALRKKKQQESEDFKNIITEKFDEKPSVEKEIAIPGKVEEQPDAKVVTGREVPEEQPDAKIVTGREVPEEQPDAKIITLEEAAAESRKLREENQIPESSHVEQVLELEATVFDTPSIKKAADLDIDEAPEIIVVNGVSRLKDNPDQKPIIGGLISQKTYDEAVSTYFVFGKPTTYSKELAKIDPRFEEFLRYIRYDATESIFDNPLKVVNDELYKNRSYLETARKIAGNEIAKIQTIKENLESSLKTHVRYKTRSKGTTWNYQLRQGTALNNDLYKYLTTGRVDAGVPLEVLEAGMQLRKVFSSIEKQAIDSGFIFHSIKNFFPRYWKQGVFRNSPTNKKRLAERLMEDEGLDSTQAYNAVDSLLNKLSDDLDPTVGSLGQRAYKKLNTVPIQDLLVDDVYAAMFLYTSSMARKIARKQLFGFSEKEFERKWLTPFFGGTIQRTTSQEGRDSIIERLNAAGFDDMFTNKSDIKEYTRLNFLIRQLATDLPEKIEDIVKLNKIESADVKEINNKKLQRDFKAFKEILEDINKMGLTRDDREVLNGKTVSQFIDDLINERIAADDFVLKTTKVDGTLSEKNVEYRQTLKSTVSSAASEKARVKKLHDYIVGIGGIPQGSAKKATNAILNGIIAGQAGNKLGLATLSSFPEMVVPLFKTQTSVATRAFLKTINDEVGQIFKNIAGPKGRTLSRQELNEFSLVLKGSLAEAVQSSYSEGMGKMTGKGLYFFYRTILLDQYTKFVQIFAYNASKIMIRDNLEKLSKMSTKELNSNSKKVRDLKLPIVKLGIDVDKGIKWIKSGERTDDLYYENIKASGARFVDDVVMNPSKESAQKPLYMTHWVGRAVFQLFSYPVAFGTTVVRNTARDIWLSGGTAAPRMMAGYALMLGMTRLIRGVKTNGESLKEDYTFSSALKDLDTMAVGGPLSIVFGYNESRKYGRNVFRAIAENIGGPTFGSAVAEFFVSGRTLGTFVKHMTPYRNIIKRTNPELLFEFDQLIKDIEDSFADKTEAEKQLRRIEDFIKFQEDQAGITKQRRQLKEELREQKVTGGLVEGTEEVPYTKENPADRIDPFTGEPYTAQMTRLGFNQGGNPTREERIAEREERDRIRKQEEETIIKSIDENLNPLQKASLIPVPIASDIAGVAGDIQMYREDPETRSLGNYALTGLGALPFVPSVAGKIKISKKTKDSLKRLENIIDETKGLSLSENYKKSYQPYPNSRYTIIPPSITQTKKDPKKLYRLMSEEQWKKAKKRGYIGEKDSLEESIYASATPERQYLSAGWEGKKNNILVEIEYSPKDQWRSKDKFAATREAIPLSRVDKIAKIESKYNKKDQTMDVFFNDELVNKINPEKSWNVFTPRKSKKDGGIK